MNKEQRAALDRINLKLEEIKEEIKTFWGPEASNDNEVVLFIQDRMFSVGRKQCEDIEGDVTEMKMISR